MSKFEEYLFSAFIINIEFYCFAFHPHSSSFLMNDHLCFLKSATKLESLTKSIPGDSSTDLGLRDIEKITANKL